MQSKKDFKARSQTVKIRVSDTELDHMHERKQEGVPLATWLRELALGQNKRRKIKSCDPQLLRELNSIGVNLNQIARGINTAKLAGDAVDLVSALTVLKSMDPLGNNEYDVTVDSPITDES